MWKGSETGITADFMLKLIEKIVIIAMQITTRIILTLSSSICSPTVILEEDITIFENMQSRYNNYIDRPKRDIL